jgi:hypothetical protein
VADTLKAAKLAVLKFAVGWLGKPRKAKPHYRYVSFYRMPDAARKMGLQPGHPMPALGSGRATTAVVSRGGLFMVAYKAATGWKGD